MSTNKTQATRSFRAHYWSVIALAFGLASGMMAQVQPEGATLSLRLVPELTISGTVGSTNQVQYVNAFGDTNRWLALTNLVLSSSPLVWYDTISPPASRRFYRTITVPPGFVWIPAGTFTMGSPDSEQDRYDNEGPQTQVTITRGFWLGRCEVTQGEYQAVMGSNPSYFGGDLNRPVEMLSWYDATNYCGKLTAADRAAGRLPAGYVYRLPTEAEWEYACRAGTTTRFSYGDDPGYAQLGNYAWYYSNSGLTTHAVGLKQPNPWGLYDMAGNVWEWCLDWYGTYPGGSVTDPQGPGSGSSRAVRGGCWGIDGRDCRSAYRAAGSTPGSRNSNVGFRAVMAYAPDGFFGEPARITQAPASQSVLAGLTASFTVQATGTAPLLYQWYKDGAKLVASARVSGVDTATLTIANVAEGDVGAYTVDVSNDWGIERTSAANLSILIVPGFVWIPAGTFTMGSLASEQDRDSDEGPQTVVTITRGFWLGRYEVTQGDYAAVMAANPSHFQGDWDRPVERVNWKDATNYCGNLTAAERAAGRLPAGYVYRLPTEAEWEYACRAGTTTRFSYGHDLNYSQLGNYAWYASNSGSTTHAVGLKPPNAWGLYDMAGNVSEWCLDWYGGYLGGSVIDPTGAASGSDRVIRGGCWYSDGRDCRSANRGNYAPDGQLNSGIGFRAVLAPGQP